MSIFRRSSVRYGRTPEPETPYQRAAQVWDERIGSARVQARNWRLMAFGSLILSCGLAGGLVWQSTHGTVVPWVVQVDKLGEAQAVAPAMADYRATDPQIAWYLAHFIQIVRSLPADPIIVRHNWLQAYDFTTTISTRVTAAVASRAVQLRPRPTHHSSAQYISTGTMMSSRTRSAGMGFSAGCQRRRWSSHRA